MRMTIAAVIATHNRPGLLANRSLASVELQTRPPDYLLVVDDSGPKTRPANREALSGFAAGEVKALYLENHRTPGLSGACNSALSWLQSVAPDAYVAFLDDDDSWAPTYLQRCEETVAHNDLDMAASGIVYHGSFEDSGTSLRIPDQLDLENSSYEIPTYRAPTCSSGSGNCWTREGSTKGWSAPQTAMSASGSPTSARSRP